MTNHQGNLCLLLVLLWSSTKLVKDQLEDLDLASSAAAALQKEGCDCWWRWGWQHLLALQKIKPWPYYPIQFLTLQFGFAVSNESILKSLQSFMTDLSRCPDSMATDLCYLNDKNNFLALPARRHTRGTQTSCWRTLLQVSDPHVFEVLRMPRSWAEYSERNVTIKHDMSLESNKSEMSLIKM